MVCFERNRHYPVCPGADHYAIGSPIIDKAVIHFESGKSLAIIAHNNSKQNVYIASAKLNGVDYSKGYITYKDVVNGGTLEFEMGSKPNMSWGSAEKDLPVLKID